MLSELLFGFIIWIVVFLFIIAVGSELFTIMVDEQIRYLRLIINYAPLPATISIPTHPEPVARYASCAVGENRDPVGCVHIRHSGRIRYGKDGRWMNMGGEAFFSLATPGFVWRATITYFPGIWLDAFDYYVDREAGMNLNLFSVIPLDNSQSDEIKEGSLFRYFACTPLVPMIHGSSDLFRWENVDDTTAKAIIWDKDRSIEALVRFDSMGLIESIEPCRKTHPVTGKLVPGLIFSNYSSYAEVEGYRIPMQIVSDLILPDGEYVHAEYSILEVEFNTPDTRRRSGS